MSNKRRTIQSDLSDSLLEIDSSFRTMKIVVIVLCILVVATLSFSAYYISAEIEQKGLKGVFQELWEGKQSRQEKGNRDERLL